MKAFDLKPASWISSTIKEVRKLLDDNITNDEERLTLQTKLKELENLNQAQILNDINSARELQKVALNQSDRFSKHFIYYLAIAITLIAFAYIFLTSFYEIPENNKRFVDILTGGVIATISTVVNFFFGSSKGSRDKDEL